MDSKQRFLSSLKKNELDRAPMDFYGSESDVMESLKKHFDTGSQEAVYTFLHADFRTAWVEIPQEYYKGPLPAAANNPEGKVTYWGLPEADDPFHPTPYGDHIANRILKDASTVHEVESFHWPDPHAFDFQAMKTDCAKHNTYVTRVVSGPLFNKVCELTGMETTLVNLLDKPLIIEAIVKRIADFYVQLYTKFFSTASNEVDVFSFWDDVATSNGLFFSKELWRKYFKKPLGSIFQVAKKHGITVQYHCCGVMKELLPDLIDIGMDILEPCQFHLPGMDAKILKKEYGKEITFFGGINTSTTLPFGTPDEVRQEVRERIDVVGKGGGYILAPDHVFQRDVPVENIIAMFDEGYRHSY